MAHWSAERLGHKLELPKVFGLDVAWELGLVRALVLEMDEGLEIELVLHCLG